MHNQQVTVVLRRHSWEVPVRSCSIFLRLRLLHVSMTRSGGGVRSDGRVQERAKEDHDRACAKLCIPAVPEPPHAEAEAEGFARCEHEIRRHGRHALMGWQAGGDQLMRKSPGRNAWTHCAKLVHTGHARQLRKHVRTENSVREEGGESA